MDRRDFLKSSAAALTVASTGRFSLAREGQRAAGRPNILFIMTDQQHAGMLSCAGNSSVRTPAMDALAAEGMRFERAYCANPVCVPSRTAMATGIMPGRLGAFNNGTGLRIDPPPEAAANSLGLLMKRAGYDTFYGGKVHMCKALTPLQHGYDEYFRNEREKLPGACVKFIRKKRDRPFFAVASFINPHDICYADDGRMASVRALMKRGAALPPDRLPPLPPNHEPASGEPDGLIAYLADRTQAGNSRAELRRKYTERDWRLYRWAYARLTEKVDGEIGNLLDGLRAAGLEENTLILFTSDHGNMDACHKLISKQLFYEESVRVPLIVRRKGATPAGVDASHLVSTGLDILPTLCDYAGIAAPAGLLGRSLRPIVEGKPVSDWRTYVPSENDMGRMIRGPRYKYFVYGSGASREFLADLQTDPGEMHNLAAAPAMASVLGDHRRMLKEWAEKSGDRKAGKFLAA